ncbi:MAG: hypothetical protein FWC78_09205 [Defluviitaleaceae bacterium]|nr:hypothetical protein [Defluviitaleaceae bacterium]
MSKPKKLPLMVALLFLAACGSAYVETVIINPEIEALGDIGQPLHIVPQLEDVHMKVTNTANLPFSVTITIFNDSSYAIRKGLMYTVEGFDGENWREIPMTKYFATPAFRVDPSESWESVKSLAGAVGSLPPGLYRIRKNIDRGTPRRDGGAHDLVAEFYWEG